MTAIPTQVQRSFQDDQINAKSAPVECLGMSFENDAARRTYFLDTLKEKLKDPKFRSIPGFPSGSDEDILRLSDPPYYTACPNPFLLDFVRHFGKRYDPDERYRREPFAADVSEGKRDPLYLAHSYHTKVPHKAIMRYILHYTEPGDVVLDGFCGTGMTGIAAKLCGSRSEITALGYRVGDDGVVYHGTQDPSGNAVLLPISKLGKRHAVLNDLSPSATFIAANYNTPVNIRSFQTTAQRILNDVSTEIGWMYATLHTDGKTQGRINYTVWSEVFSCPECSKEIVFVREALDQATGAIREAFPCPHCNVESKKDELNLLYESSFDQARGIPVSFPRRVPALINYTVAGKKYQKKPDSSDIELLKKIAALPLPPEVPTLELPDMQMMRVGRMQPSHITHIHHFFLKRPTHALASLWRRAASCPDARIRNFLLFFIEQSIWGMSVLARYVPTHYSQVNQFLSGVFYVASQIVDPSPWYILDGKLDRLVKAFQACSSGPTIAGITTQDLAHWNLPDCSIDYIFTDPPFGENIYYSDLNILLESWHRVITAPSTEAIVDRVKGRTLLDYQRLMTDCFVNYCRMLKPGRWMTVEFHNSRNSVWNSIQEALQHAGFVVADVRTLDKKQGSFQQIVSGNTVKRDLIISAYKPNGGLEDRFKLKAGTEAGVWDFVETHLRQLPVFVSKDGAAEPVAERQTHLLFDRMVAFHVQRGVSVPLASPEFHAGLQQQYPERDGMYFLPEQVAEYDKKRMATKDIIQLELFVSDEASAIQWLKQQLTKKPQTFQELHPQYLKEISGWLKHEERPELLALLEQNFIRYDGPDPKARDRWYVPDPAKSADLEKLRERALLREFDAYRELPQKKLKVIRLEAVRTGFRRAWQQNEYNTILEVAEKIPLEILQEDSMLLMWYTNSLTRAGKQS
jgi:DNA methylase